MDKYQKTDLCNGFGLGITCVGCCYEISTCDELREVMHPRIKLKVKNFPFLNPDGNPVTSIYLGSTLNGLIPNHPPFCTRIERYAYGIESIDSNFEESLRKFNEIIEKNTKNFEEQLRKSVSLEEIAKGNGFVGRINGRIGCLLYQFEDPSKKPFYRDEACRHYVCGLGQNCDSKSQYGKTLEKMKEFIKFNKRNEKFNTLGYSRLVHLISSHQDMIYHLGISLSLQDDVNKSIKELNKLLEIVTR